MKGLTAMIAVGFGLSIASGAADAAKRYNKRVPPESAGNYELSKRKPQVRGYYFRPGGHSYDFEYEPYIRKYGPYGNFPEPDNRTFHEKVLSDPRLPTTAPSAF